MIRQILWKEWRENRWKYITLWLTFNAPILLIAIFVAVSRSARTPFADLSDQTMMKYMPLSLGEGILVASFFVAVTALVAVSSFRNEIDNGGLFFVFDQPMPRKRYVAAKLFHGAGHAALASIFAILFAPAATYALMLLSGKVTLAGSSASFNAVFAAAARSTLWCALISVVAFTASALISSIAPRWWIAATGAFLFAVFLARFVQGDSALVGGGSFFEIIPEIPDTTMSVSANFGNGQWLNVSNVLPLPAGYAHWKLLPPLFALGITAVLSLALAMVYERKEER